MRRLLDPLSPSSAVMVLATLLLAFPAAGQTILHYDFDETGTTAASQGASSTPLTLRNDAGTAVDLHSADARGVSGRPGDRSFQNTSASDHGSSASAATNGFRADQPDDAAVDGLTAFTISGWFRTGDWTTLSGKTPRLVENHDGTNGFNLQFLSGSVGDLKLEVDSTTTPAPLEASSGTTGLYSGKNTWIFFAVRYDGTSSSGNVEFYRGFRNDVEAAELGASSAAVQLVAASSLGCTTCTLDRGAVNADTAGLVVGNRNALGRPYDGFIDDLRVDSGLTDAADLETYRSGAIASDPIEIAWVGTTSVATTVQDQNQNTITVNELSALAYDASSDRFWAVSDKNGRLIELDVEFAANGAIVSATALSAVVVADSDDFEGIALQVTGASSVFLSDEEASPLVREYALSDGSLVQSLGIPSVFDSSRANLRFESLARSHDDTEMIASVQQALTVDGPAGTSTTVPSVARMLRFAVSGPSASAAEQYAYVIEPLHAAPQNGDGSSLSDVEFLPDGRILSIERSEGNGETLVRIFEVERIGATDVGLGATASGLIGQTYTPVGKTLLLAEQFGKLEGFAVGPQLPDGRHAALAVEDNSGSGPNVLHSFIVDFGAEPPAVPVFGPIGAALLGGALIGGTWLQVRSRRSGR
jgi:hypothetical protein